MQPKCNMNFPTTHNYGTIWKSAVEYVIGIVSLIASEQFAKNPPPRRIGKPSNMVQNMDIWKSGYLDI